MKRHKRGKMRGNIIWVSGLCVLSLLLGVFRVHAEGSMAGTVPEPTQVIKDLRSKALTLSPSEIGVSPSPETPHVWGVLMETGYPEALATLVALADGTVSLYLGHGGGIIGGGEHANVRQAGKALLSSAEQHLAKLSPTTLFPLPNVGRVRFYVLTFSGALTADVDENELGQRRHELSKLFYAGQNVITELRKISEMKGK